jgi:hypothetical protein
MMPASLDVSNSMPLTDVQQNALIARMKLAWAKLPDDKQAALKPLLERGHEELGNYLDTGTPPAHDVRNVLRMKSI